MKKTLLSLVVLSSLILSCSRNNDNNNEETTKQELSTKNVTFVDARQIKLKNQEISKVDGASVDFKFTLGRQSKHCSGFGICEVIAFSIEIYTMKSVLDYSGVITNTNNIEGSSNSSNNLGGFILLAHKIDDNTYDTSLTIEQDIKVSNENYIVKKGKYSLNKNLGEFGGYQLNIEKL